jgi:hypothetical protein
LQRGSEHNAIPKKLKLATTKHLIERGLRLARRSNQALLSSLPMAKDNQSAVLSDQQLHSPDEEQSDHKFKQAPGSSPDGIGGGCWTPGPFVTDDSGPVQMQIKVKVPRAPKNSPQAELTQALQLKPPNTIRTTITQLVAASANTQLIHTTDEPSAGPLASDVYSRESQKLEIR